MAHDQDRWERVSSARVSRLAADAPGRVAQARLFDLDLDLDAEPTGCDACLQIETSIDNLSAIRDTRANQFEKLVARLRQATSPIDQAVIAAKLQALAAATLAQAVIEANGAGHTWREIGAELGVPFQTLYRRYGGDGGN